MTCDSCKSTVAARLWYRFPALAPMEQVCDICAVLPSATMPDVYLGTKGGIQTDEMLCDPKTNQPIPFSSKQEKAAIMKRLKVQQDPRAERQHGYRHEEKRRSYFI